MVQKMESQDSVIGPRRCTSSAELWINYNHSRLTVTPATENSLTIRKTTPSIWPMLL